MKVMGVELETPSTARALGHAAVFLMSCWFIAVIAKDYPDMNPFGLCAGALGGAVASAYGVSFRKHGVKAIVITMVFVFVLALLAKGVRVLFV